MLTEYICHLCGLRISSDIEREFKCLKCGNKTELTLKEEWVGDIESGSDNVFIRGIVK